MPSRAAQNSSKQDHHQHKIRSAVVLYCWILKSYKAEDYAVQPLMQITDHTFKCKFMHFWGRCPSCQQRAFFIWSPLIFWSTMTIVVTVVICYCAPRGTFMDCNVCFPLWHAFGLLPAPACFTSHMVQDLSVDFFLFRPTAASLFVDPCYPNYLIFYRIA